MGKPKMIITTGVFIFLFSYGNITGSIGEGGSNSGQQDSKTTQTKTKSTQPVSKPVQAKTKTTQTVSKSTQTKAKSAKPVSKSVPAKSKTAQPVSKPEPDTKNIDFGIVTIGVQKWAAANLNVSTFRNGDTIPEAKTSKEWVIAGESGKPAWCYYNNDPAIGLLYGKLYNWFAVNDPRGLAPAGWTLPNDADWAKLINYLGGQGAAGSKMKNTSRWREDNNGTNESGFTGFPGGYRVENGSFLNIGSIGIWWSSSEYNLLSAIDHYLAQNNSAGRSNSPKQRGESVRCLRK